MALTCWRCNGTGELENPKLMDIYLLVKKECEKREAKQKEREVWHPILTSRQTIKESHVWHELLPDDVWVWSHTSKYYKS